MTPRNLTVVSGHDMAMLEKRTKIKDKAKRMIWVTFQKEGIHCYPAATSDPNLSDVEFLGHPHRHIFHFKVGIEVYHNDRDLEFIQVKRWLEQQYTNGTLELNHKSCEMIADDIYDIIAIRFPMRDIRIYPFRKTTRTDVRYTTTKYNINFLTAVT